MRFDNFAIVIEKEPEEYGPSLPGGFSNGRTVGEAKRIMRGAISCTSPNCSPTANLCRRFLEHRRQTGLQQTRGATLLRVPSGLVSSVSAAAGASRPFVPPQRRHGLPGSHGPDGQKIYRDWLTYR
jgi:hypothetical protein